LTLLLASLLLLLATPAAYAKITDAEIRKEDRLLVPLDEPFGFGPNGNINITLTNFVLRPLYDPKRKTVAKPNLQRMGIFITTPYGGMLLDEEVSSEGRCALDSEEQITLITFDQIDLTLNSVAGDFSLADMLEDYAGGEFILYFANCEPDTAVDFDITLALYNKKGAKLDFLPVGEDTLPLLYLVSTRRSAALISSMQCVSTTCTSDA